ncbi:MAG: YraN family protein [Proteobacteria bacterium]|nr:YraN family protein [Pseudomonadota bacterium]
MFKEPPFSPKPTHLEGKKQSPTQSKGHFAETLALEYLQKNGLKYITRQFSCKMGEIDLIMQDINEVVFVEVRSLTNPQYGEPFETITYGKQRKILRTARYFLHCYPWTNEYSARIDVVSISGNQLNPKITWIPNAFGVE